MKTIIIFLLCTPFLFSAEYAILQKIADGDTFTFKSQQHNEFKCRVFGIDTPEKFHSAKMNKDADKVGITPETMKKAGEASTQYAQQNLKVGKNYKVDVLEKDKYGRELCIVYDGDKSYNEAIIADGYAVVYKNGKYIKDDSLKRTLLQAQKEAKSNNRGLWNGHTKRIMEGME
jgi:endonuclease YncB( thermonuclease family)